MYKESYMNSVTENGKKNILFAPPQPRWRCARIFFMRFLYLCLFIFHFRRFSVLGIKSSSFVSRSFTTSA